MAAAIEAQATSVVGVRRTERTRPVVAVLTHVESISTVAPASSREEDTAAVRAGNLITFMSTLGCPGPIALITEFFKLCAGRHAPCAAPFLTGGVVTAGRADARLAVNLVDAPTVARVVKAVKAVVPVVTLLRSVLAPGIVATIIARAACANVLRCPLHAQAKVNIIITIDTACCGLLFAPRLPYNNRNDDCCGSHPRDYPLPS